MAKEVSVTSTVYNLAGDESKRPHFLKSVVLGAATQGADSLGEVIVKAYLDSPALKFRNFLRWTKNNTEFQSKFGITSGQLRTAPQLDSEVIAPNLPKEAGEISPKIRLANIGQADISYWVLQYLAQTHPNESLDYTYIFKEDTKEVILTFADGVVESFEAVNFVRDASYLYVYYTPILGEILIPKETGSKITLADGVDFPELDIGWKPQIQENPLVRRALKITESVSIYYSDGRPSEDHTSTRTRKWSAQKTHEVFWKDVYQGKGPDPETQVYSQRSIRTQDLVYELKTKTEHFTTYDTIEGGVTRTTITMITTEYMRPVRTYQTDLVDAVHYTWLPPRYFLYRKDSVEGSPLNALFEQASAINTGIYYPPIPFRYGTEAISEDASIWVVDLPFKWIWNINERLWIAPNIAQTHKAIWVLPRETLDDSGGADGSTYRYEVYAGGDKDDEPCLISDVLDTPGLPVAQMRGRTSNGTEWKSDWVPLKSKPQPDLSTVSSLAPLLPLCKKAFKKALGYDYGKIQDKILKNKNIRDIDYVYAVFGVSLNVEENACRKYVFKFFENLMATMSPDPNEETEWWGRWNAAVQDELAFQASLDETKPSVGMNVVEYPSIPWKYLQTAAEHEETTNYKTDIQWAFITPGFGAGVLQVPVSEGVTRNAKRGDVWFEVLDNPLDPTGPTGQLTRSHYERFNQKIAMYWQEAADSWKRLTITGLHYQNFIYRDHGIRITAKEALEDSKESGFIIPLHEDLYREMGLVDATQMATACVSLVFNCYAEREIAWYESDWFMILMIGAIIVISIGAAIISGGTSLGLLGSAASVGSALGASGLLGIIIGAAINALAGIALGYLLQAGSIELFGEKWGGLIGGILMTALTLGMAGAASGLALWENLGTAQGLLALSSATLTGLSQTLQAGAKEIQENTEKMMKKWGQDQDKIQKLLGEFDSRYRIDPTLATKYISELNETPEQFLSRTLMTGSDIVKATLDMVDNFADYQLHLA